MIDELSWMNEIQPEAIQDELKMLAFQMEHLRLHGSALYHLDELLHRGSGVLLTQLKDHTIVCTALGAKEPRAQGHGSVVSIAVARCLFNLKAKRQKRHTSRKLSLVIADAQKDRTDEHQ
jgi:hypothetical protein